MTKEAEKPEAAEAAPEPTEEQLWSDLATEREGRAVEDEDPPPREQFDDAADDDDGTGEKAEAADGDPPASDEDDSASPRDEAPHEEEPNDDPQQEQRRELAEHQVRSLAGRLRALKRHAQEASGAPKDRVKELETAAERLEEKMSDYPDILGVVNDQLKLIRDEIADMRSQDQAEWQEVLAAEAETFQELRPDGFNIVSENAEAFRQWVEDQPKRIRDIVRANESSLVDGAGAAEVVNLFEKHLKPAEEPPAQQQTQTRDSRRERQLRGAQAPSSRPSRVTSNADAGAMTDEQYWEHLAKQREQRATR